MIKIENVEVMGWEHAIRGMRNPMNSWEKSDSKFCSEFALCEECPAFDADVPCQVINADPLAIGPNDHQLMMNLAHGGPVHAKYRRMITVYLDITAPLYWWKEFDTYKAGTVANSCSTMHKIHAKYFELSDFSHEHLLLPSKELLIETLKVLNRYRDLYLGYTGFESWACGPFDKKEYWHNMIQLLPTSYNQKRTVMLNYEVLAAMYESRKNHKLDEWREFCKWIESLPYSELIIGEVTYVEPEPVVSKGDGPNGIVRTQEEIEADRKKLEKDAESIIYDLDNH